MYSATLVLSAGMVVEVALEVVVEAPVE